MNRWRRALAVYADPKIFLITVMGFSSGLPLLLTLSTLSYWLAKLGVSKTSIGLFAAVGVPYSFKFLWAPLLDQIRPPFLGRRRGWAIIIQAALALAILAMGFTDPAVNPWWTALAAVVVAFLSASQDIVIDAYRIEILPLKRSRVRARRRPRSAIASAFLPPARAPWRWPILSPGPWSSPSSPG